MPYIGRGPQKQGAFRILDDISGSFNGSTTSFALASGSNTLSINTPETLIIAVDGVIQEPGSAYTISGSNIVFGSPPAAEASFWGVELGDIGTQTVTTDATEASKTNMEAEATGVLYAPPDLIKHSPGVAKGYCRVAAAGTIVSGSYNVSSVTDVDTGNRTIVWNVDFANANYSALGSLGEDTNAGINISFSSYATGSVGLLCRDTEANATSDIANACAAFGDQ